MAKKNGTKKRAIALAGGGPAAGLHIGALAALEEADIQFDVFSLSCIGAWVGLVYNSRTPPPYVNRTRAHQTFDFFEEYCFRDDASYEWFPLNRGFAMDLFAMAQAWAEFVCYPGLDVSKLVLPAEEGLRSIRAWQDAFSMGQVPSQSQLNYLFFNHFFAVHPVMRYIISSGFKSRINGLSRIYYDDSPALREVFRGECLYDSKMPQIYHNAWRMAKGAEAGRIQIFHNRPEEAGNGDYLKITPKSLCACSALPYIEESVEIDGIEYTEGALVDTVNFAPLLRDNQDIDEVWINRIVDENQVKPARDLAGALGNLPMQFAAEVGEDDVKLFREHLRNQTSMRPRVVEIPLRKNTQVTFEWKHSNLQQGFREGYEAVTSLLAFDPELKSNAAPNA